MILRTDGKKYGKAWRSRIRELLSQTFAALNAKPLDGALCLRLSEQIEAELRAIEEGTIEVESSSNKIKKKRALVDEIKGETKEVCFSECDLKENTRTIGGEKPRESVDFVEELSAGEDILSSRMAAGHSEQGEPRMAEGHSGVGAQAPETEKTAAEVVANDASLRHVPADEIGLFDLIRVRIRCFFKINACVRPPYIGRFVRFADKFSEAVQSRIDKFIGVLDKGDEDFVARTEVEVGYRDELIPDMPDMGLVLHPKKKKKR